MQMENTRNQLQQNNKSKPIKQEEKHATNNNNTKTHNTKHPDTSNSKRPGKTCC